MLAARLRAKVTHVAVSGNLAPPYRKKYLHVYLFIMSVFLDNFEFLFN